MISPAIEQLIQALRCLPGVGTKSAQRMAFYLLAGHREEGLQLSDALKQALTEVKQCAKCQIFTEQTYCTICSHTKREPSQLCIVQNTSDVIAFEQTSQYKGLYFVLHGVLSPIDGITPQQLGLEALANRLETEPIEEIIVATYATAEGEATAHYITQLAAPYKVKCTRLAYGIPHGGEFEYLDATTLGRALTGRQVI